MLPKQRLKSFARDYPMAKLFLLYGGEDTFYEDNITVLPIVKALKNLHTILMDGVVI